MTEHIRPPEEPTAPQQLTLAGDFAGATRDDWHKLVEQTLKGADYATLRSTLEDGITVEPIYARGDLERHAPPPGAAPFLRGAHGADGREPAWAICAHQQHRDPGVANRQLLDDLDGGANAVCLVLDDGVRGGTRVRSRDDLGRLLDGVLLGLVDVHLDGGAAGPAAAALLLANAAEGGSEDARLCGTLGLDPVGVLARSGVSEPALADALAQACDVACLIDAEHEGLRTLCADGRVWAHAGASPAQEIAAALATGTAYLRTLEGCGMALDRAAAQIAFTLTTDADFFTSIAKLRAARRLWAQITAACGVPAAAMQIRAETSMHMMSVEDPYVNMLRTCVAAAAAGMAGAQAVTVRAFTSAGGDPDDFARRIARNTQAILQEESFLGRVLDPAGGSWYVEALSDALARAAWDAFTGIEAEGGIAASLTDGKLQARIAANRATREAAVARRDAERTGVNTYPNLEAEPATAFVEDRPGDDRDGAEADKPLGPLPAPRDGALARALIAAARGGATVPAMRAALAGSRDQAEPLPAVRLGEAFEWLRAAARAHGEENGQRPRVFLANLGAPAAFTARATFARHFFGTGGIEALGSEGFSSADEAARAFKASGARLAAICGSDEAVDELGADVARALKAAGAKLVYLAQRPGDGADALEDAGVDAWIHQGVDAIEVLTTAHRMLGIKPR